MMARPGERLRLKDRIIDNISKAIKSIQELVYYQYKDPTLPGCEDGVVLHNNSRQCHRLCENIDHTLLHGLKHVMHGYWRIVKQLSPHVIVKEIDMLANVTTELGKGRAWLYVSLNEGLLESYIRLLFDNDKLLRKYYAKEALVLDRDRMSVLLTLVSGLDCVKFRLDYDVPYLDLNAYPPRSRHNSEQERDVSSDSSDSYLGHPCRYRSRSEVSAYSGTCSNPHASDSDSISLTSEEAHGQMKDSTISFDSGFSADNQSLNGTRHHSLAAEALLITKFQKGASSDSVSLSSVSSSGDPDRHQRLESFVTSECGAIQNKHAVDVVHIKSKKTAGAKSKKKKAETESGRKKGNKLSVDESSTKVGSLSQTFLKSDKRQSSSSLEQVVNCGNAQCTLPTALDCDNDVQCDKNVCSSDALILCDNKNNASDAVNPVVTSYSHFLECPRFPEGMLSLSFVTASEQSTVSQTVVETGRHLQDVASKESAVFSLVGQKYLNSVDSSQEVVNMKPGSVQSDVAAVSKAAKEQLEISDAIEVKQDLIDKTSSPCIRSIPDLSERDELTLQTEVLTDDGPSNLQIIDDLEDSLRQQSLACVDERDNFYCDNQERSIHDCLKDDNLPLMTEEVGDIYSCNNVRIITETCGNDNHPTSSLEDKTHLQKSALTQPDLRNIAKPENKDMAQQLLPKCSSKAVKLDNNTVLQIMLYVFTHEDEKFVKIFQTPENHTDGGCQVIFVLISDQCLYILHYTNKMFVCQSSIMLGDIRFLSTGLNEQTLNIEFRDRNKQKNRLWLTPGNQNLTPEILACLTDAVKMAHEHLPAKTRFSVGSEVPLQKIALRKYVSREVGCRSQDVTLSDYSLVFWEDLAWLHSPTHSSLFKEGSLSLRVQHPGKGFVWKQVYVILKDSLLRIKSSSHKAETLHTLSLGGDQCVGCRLTSLVGQDYCLELVLAHRGSWFLSAQSGQDISAWQHSLCLAVSRGTMDNDTFITCVPCCAVLACDRLFLYHEELHTKFYRTLSQIKLEDVTSVMVDITDPTYYIMKLKSPHSVPVVYLNSAQDLERHLSAFKSTWSHCHKRELPQSHIDDVSIRDYCQAYAGQLRRQLTFS